MMLMLVHASVSENGNAGWDGKAKAGDQTKREVCTRSFYTGWNVMLRYKDSSIASKATDIATKIANSNLVGYDQSQRNDLYKQLKKYNFDVDKYIKSGIKSETDCSAFQYAVYCCLIPSMRQDGNAPTTSTMRNFYKNHGFTVYTDTKYLKTDEYLIKGDILVKEGSHVVQNITNGSKTTSTKSSESTVKNTVPSLADPVIKSGSTGNNVKNLQKDLNYLGFKGSDNKALTVDGSAGKNTIFALKNFEKKYGLIVDGIYGEKCKAKMKKLLV